jgi:hypothetical protein
MATLLMASHRRSTSPRVPAMGAATVSVFTTRMVRLLFNMEKGRRKTALEAWENERGRVAADSAREPFSINTETEAR